jgi:tRNA A37 threonylcarbamoyltransferase TsaD
LLEDEQLRPPVLGLVVSGGHSDLIRWQPNGEIAVIGRTRDDAAGEAFDKGARILGLPFPGGPAIDKLAASGLKVMSADGTRVQFDGPRCQLDVKEGLDHALYLSDTAAIYRFGP